MPMTDPLQTDGTTRRLPIRSSEDIVVVRTAVRQAAIHLKFGIVDQTKLVTAASELARNTLSYGGGGSATIELLDHPKTGIRLCFEDSGPGIVNIELALTDGWSSGAGMGLGLTGSRRLVDDFNLASKLGEGTTVTITKWSR
jgi:serine/threonine-protein kinase RsbT